MEYNNVVFERKTYANEEHHGLFIVLDTCYSKYNPRTSNSTIIWAPPDLLN